jgi:hypothetical protein
MLRRYEVLAMIALVWPLVVFVLGVLALALLYDLLQAWLRGIRSEREVLATSLDTVRAQLQALDGGCGAWRSTTTWGPRRGTSSPTR